jgi:hypothetical protein
VLLDEHGQGELYITGFFRPTWPISCSYRLGGMLRRLSSLRRPFSMWVVGMVGGCNPFAIAGSVLQTRAWSRRRVNLPLISMGTCVAGGLHINHTAVPKQLVVLDSTYKFNLRFFESWIWGRRAWLDGTSRMLFSSKFPLTKLIFSPIS